MIKFTEYGVKLSRILMMIMVLTACGPNNEKICPENTCDKYSTQQEAQQAYDSDPDCSNELDNDNDGLACEHLTNTGTGGTTGCPTTANCGCSNKNKDQCASACCQWIVGTGCRCK